MKKLFSTILVLLMAAILVSGMVLTSCGEPEETTTPTTTQPTSTQPTTTQPTETEPDKHGGTLTCLYP